MKHAIRHIHFVGLGGAGMSGIAEVLFNLGYRISGSDLADSATLRRLQGLPERTQQAQRQQGQRDQTLAAHARKINQLQRKAVLGHDARFHAAGRAQPVHSPAARTQLFGHCKAREDVAAGAAGHDESSLLAHTRPPRMGCCAARIAGAMQRIFLRNKLLIRGLRASNASHSAALTRCSCLL